MSETPTAIARAAARDEDLIRRCLGLARRGEGSVSPNPMVGAIVARGRRVVSVAYHHRAGGPHAEVLALRRAGRMAQGASLYVNLEPCCHYGRTPPCVDAIVAAGIRRVVSSHADPFPRVRGRGFAALRGAGVEVDVGICRREAEQLNERYLTFIRKSRPFVLVKVAATLDGKIATHAGASRWVTSSESRRRVHHLRGCFDAVMVGANTAVKDDPRLTSRGAGSGRQPVRVVLDGRLRLSPDARLLNQKRAGPVIIYTVRGAPVSRARRLQRRGAIVVTVAGAPAPRVDLRAALSDLGRRGIASVMIEGGGELIASALRESLADKVSLFLAPVLLGGRRSLPMMAGREAASLSDSILLTRMKVFKSGPDLLIEGYPAGRRG